MAEYDDLVRRAAEAVRSAGSMCVCENDDLNLERVTEVLTPFVAAARKEAREGALREAATKSCQRCEDGLSVWFDGRRPYHRKPPGMRPSSCSAWRIWRIIEELVTEEAALTLIAAREDPAALRSKPEEPA